MKRVDVDGRAYDLDVMRQVVTPVEAPRLVIPAHLPTEAACEILACCLRAIRRFTSEPHEVWVVDNNSPRRSREWLAEQSGINVVFNRTEPAPPGYRGVWTSIWGGLDQRRWGSYANGVAVEIASCVIDPGSERMMTLHMDTAPCRDGWLGYLAGKMSRYVPIVGVRLQRARVPEGVIHILGCMVDFQMVKRLGLSWLPDLPSLDAGDRISVGLRAAGFNSHACRNTHEDPSLDALLPERLRGVECALDHSGNVIFLHLGRGVLKSRGERRNGLTVERWVELVNDLSRRG